MLRIVKWKDCASSDLERFGRDIAEFLLVKIVEEFACEEVTMRHMQRYQDLESVYHVDYMIGNTIYSAVYTYESTQDSGVVEVRMAKVLRTMVDHEGTMLEQLLEDFRRFVGLSPHR